MGPRPRQHTPRPPPSLPASLHERNIAPAGHSTAWLTSSVKEKSPPLTQNWRKTTLSRMQGRIIFHRTPQHLRQGRFFFHPVRSIPHKRDKIRPARLHQRPRAKKFAQRTQNTPKSAYFRLLGEFFRGSDQNPLQLGELFRADGATATSQHLPTTLPETDDTNARGLLSRDETAGTSASS